MYKTEHGIFNGDSWEQFCKACFKLKYEIDGYQDMPASPGDYGIEGFTRTGLVFQCYCPDVEYPPDKLYEEQRDKITRDLTKLALYEKELLTYLKNIKIKQWIFVTPGYRKKELVKHCHDKAEEYKKKNLSILDSKFDVLIHDIDFYCAQIPIVLAYKQQKISIVPNEISSDEEIADWKAQQITLVSNAINKHQHRIPNNSNNIDEKVNKLTQYTIENFLNGNILIRKWHDNYPEDYEKFVRVVSQFEKKVSEKCILHDGSNNNQLYKEIESELRTKIKENFAYIEDVMIDKLTEQVMADWILRCPINFE